MNREYGISEQFQGKYPQVIEMRIVHTKYRVSKLRFGRDGKWDESWQYEAVSFDRTENGIGNDERGVTGRYDNLDSLAKELSTFRGIRMAEFYQETEGKRVSLAGSRNPIFLTQSATISDEELGELGRLVSLYANS